MDCKRMAELLRGTLSGCGDREVLYIGALLHDTGVLAPYQQDLGDFEIVGAQLTERRLLSAGASGRLAASVRTAIELHTEMNSAGDSRPEVALLHMGTFGDVTGARINERPAGRRAAIVEAFPRTGGKDALIRLLREQAAFKP